MRFVERHKYLRGDVVDDTLEEIRLNREISAKLVDGSGDFAG